MPLDQLLPVDRWILDRASRAVERCRQAYDEYEFHVVYHRILELCTVDLSSIYLDASKDTMYCDAPASRERRSAQTAMYHVLRGIVSVIAPILSFTADEIYEAMPGEKEASVHLTEIPKLDSTLRRRGREPWTRVLRLRDAVLGRARARARGEADRPVARSRRHAVRRRRGANVDLAKLFIVSHVDVEPADDTSPTSSRSKARPHRHRLAPRAARSAVAAGSTARRSRTKATLRALPESRRRARAAEVPTAVH